MSSFFRLTGALALGLACAAAPLAFVTAAQAEEAAQKRILYYRNPMGLADTSPVPKKDGMGMDYIPVHEGEDDESAVIKIAPGKLQRTGVRSEPATTRTLVTNIRVPGTIQLDERRITLVSTRSTAFIEKVAEITTGEKVKKGQVLFRFYSPEIASAAAQYFSNPGFEGARKRLDVLDVPAEFIAEIDRARKIPLNLEWRAPRDGIVFERNAFEGMKAEPGQQLFKIVDLQNVWALVDVAERDFSRIKPGQKVLVQPRGMPDRAFSGVVSVIYPRINTETRTARVRVELQNPDLLLRPDMYVDAEISAGDDGKVIAVPDSAVIDSGARQTRPARPGRGPLRAARGQAWPARRRICRDTRGRRRRRKACDLGQFPHRRREQPQGGAQNLWRGEMIARLIAWSARNLVLVLIGTAFLVAAGVHAVKTLPLDALPDLSDAQVIVYTEYSGQAPQVVEDQVTYPLASAMLTVPKSKVVRGFSFFGVSFVYIIFEDGTDLYWARSRVLEFLGAAGKKLPAGVTPTLGPDATGVGWVYQYAVVAKEMTLAELRSLQDWTLRYGLAKAEGVAEVASVGGFVKQYNVVVDPIRLKALNISLQKVRDAIRASNTDVGGRSVELSEFEYIVRARGYLRGVSDLEQIVLKAEGGTPLLLKDVARVEIGPDERRGITELNGEGEVASGIALQRYGANALSVIDNVKAALAQLAPSLPKGVEILPVYDRSQLIHAAIETLKHTLAEESVIVALVCIVFLLHVRSALVAIVMLPVGVLMAFAAMKALGLSSNIMSLGGIAIAIGAMVDAAIVMIENAHKHLERAAPETPRLDILIEAASEVGPALFFSLLVITVSFLPIFALEAQEGRLFSPLAYTKTFAMAAAAFLSVTLVPALMVVFVRGRIIAEHKNPINRFLIWIYRPVIATVLRARIATILLAVAILAVTVLPAQKIGSEFMPTLNEGTLLYMPTTLPGLSVTKAAELLQTQDRIIKNFAEVESAYGKAGRVSSATDPAPTEMFETVIQLKPKEQWRARPHASTS